MDDDMKIIQDECAQHKGEIVIDMGMDRLVRLDGVIEDEMDIYWVYTNKHGEVYYGSCVGGFTPLKPYLPQEDYEILKRSFDINLNTWEWFLKSRTIKGKEYYEKESIRTLCKSLCEMIEDYKERLSDVQNHSGIWHRACRRTRRRLERKKDK